MNLCPICDRKLVGNICPSCKKIIRNPLVIPDGIRLNESHYGNDDMCEFHANDRHIPFMNRRHPEQEPELRREAADGGGCRQKDRLHADETAEERSQHHSDHRLSLYLRKHHPVPVRPACRDPYLTIKRTA